MLIICHVIHVWAWSGVQFRRKSLHGCRTTLPRCRGMTSFWPAHSTGFQHLPSRGINVSTCTGFCASLIIFWLPVTMCGGHNNVVIFSIQRDEWVSLEFLCYLVYCYLKFYKFHPSSWISEFRLAVTLFLWKKKFTRSVCILMLHGILQQIIFICYSSSRPHHVVHSDIFLLWQLIFYALLLNIQQPVSQ